MTNYEKEYKKLIRLVLHFGSDRCKERTGAGALSYFYTSINVFSPFGAPLLTGRQMFYKGIIGEVLAFLNGATNIKDFKKYGCNYWDNWADSNGNLGPIYGKQWVEFNGQNVNQIQNIINEAKQNPESRRLLVSAWNPAQQHEMALPPCFHSFQLNIDNNNLNMLANMRSVDLMVGFPSDVFFHYVLQQIFCAELGLEPGKLCFAMGDVHIYKNHFTGCAQYLRRKQYDLPNFKLINYQGIDKLTQDNFVITNYKHKEKINFTINE